MTKSKAAAADGSLTTNITPIGQGKKPSALGAMVPTVIVFGLDDAGKAHASWFTKPDAELAEKAAGLMGYKVLPVTSPDIAAKAQELAEGRIFSSGKGFRAVLQDGRV